MIVAVSAAILALISAGVLIARRGVLRETTLVAPLYWAVFALVSLASVEILASFVSQRPVWLAHLRFLAACTTFCPLMAVLGAKRPQDRGWQFVVLTLLGVLAFYGLTDLAYWPEVPPSLPWVLRWLLVMPLVAMGLLNHLPTRFWPSALLIAAGQLLLLSPQLPEIQALLPTGMTGDAVLLAAVACLTLAVMLAAWGMRKVHQPPSIDRLWIDFRNAFGSFWAIRVAARFNQSAAMHQWGVSLSWQGLTVLDTARHAEGIDPKVQAAMRQTLQSLLRRFADRSWIDRRFGPG